MGFNVLEWFAQEYWKFDLFLDTKTLIAPINLKLTSLVKTLIVAVNLKSASSVLKFCLLHDISFYGRAKGT